MKIQPNFGFWQNEPKFRKTLCLALDRSLATDISSIGRRHRERPIWRAVIAAVAEQIGHVFAWLLCIVVSSGGREYSSAPSCLPQRHLTGSL
jgi:hypothetical protein